MASVTGDAGSALNPVAILRVINCRSYVMDFVGLTERNLSWISCRIRSAWASCHLNCFDPAPIRVDDVIGK